MCSFNYTTVELVFCWVDTREMHTKQSKNAPIIQQFNYYKTTETKRIAVFHGMVK